MIFLLFAFSTALREFHNTHIVCNSSVDPRDGRWLCESIDAPPLMTTPRNDLCTYAPFGCRLPSIDRDALLSLAETHFRTRQRALWLYVAGDSRSRGLWLHLVDLLIANTNLTTSRAFKCWGRSDFHAPHHHLRLTWHDVRASEDDPSRAAPTTMHNLDAQRQDFDSSLRWFD